LAGGFDGLMQKARTALSGNDPVWAAQLAQHAMRLQPQAKEPKLLLAEALDIAGERTFNAPARNYTLAYAERLRRQAEGKE
jgi:alkyl sulfatase BDS1-like metallo-beta-lactamase superfamily hydrolase